MRHSTSYVMTVDTRSASQMFELEMVRKSVKIMNADLRAAKTAIVQGLPVTTTPSDAKQYYVKSQGRGARTAPALRDGKHPRRYDQSLPLRHADRLDVYIYRR